LGANDNPTLVLLQLVCVLDQLKPELVDVKVDGFVVNAKHESDMRDAPLQTDLLCQTYPVESGGSDFDWLRVGP
jgi:hypothetical protein